MPWTGLASSPRSSGRLSPVAPASPAPAARARLLAAPFGWPARTPPEVWLAAAAVALALGRLAPRRGARLCCSAGRGGLASRAAVAAAWRVCVRRGWPRAVRREPELALLDVGQGDAILLRDGDRAVLVDGGGWERGDLGGRVLLPALLAEGVRRLDAVVMTHPDRDHCGGLVDIAAYLPVREVWMGAGWEAAGCAGELLAPPGRRAALPLGGRARRASAAGVSRVLHPEADERRGDNERSLVLLAEAVGRRVLLTGDIESWAEHRLLSLLRRATPARGHPQGRPPRQPDLLDRDLPGRRPPAPRPDLGRRPTTSTTTRRRRSSSASPSARSPSCAPTAQGMVRLRVRRRRRVRVELPGMPR